MKYHLHLLKKYISVETSAEELAQNLILKTCEIEEIEQRRLAPTIVIGKVKSFIKHPNADKLNICQVNCGTLGQHQIVCGGENIETDIYVPVALVGTHLPAIDLTIGARAVRGIESAGMICAKSELGINEDGDQHRIWNLGLDLEITDEDIGLALVNKFPWLESVVLEVENKSLTNRPDLTGHFGIAIELNAMYVGSQKKYAKILEYMDWLNTANVIDILTHSEKQSTRKIICTSDAVKSYIALELNKISVQTSDFFTRLQLLDLWTNPINNWVDFSNLFMNISGVPVHFFDADKVQGNIHLRNAYAEEKFIDLFGKEHNLQTTDLVIADEHKALALAGIIGGMESGITDTTKNIIVEIANFDPVVVRKTGTRLGLRTDAELRFEKNINPQYSLVSLLLFLDELKYYSKSLGNYEIGSVTHYLTPDFNPYEKKFIPLDWEKIQSLIFGQQSSDFIDKATQILKDLGFTVNGAQVQVPLWRGPDDINIAEDIAEEIARIRGYDRIPEQPMLTESKAQTMSEEIAITRQLESLFVEQLHFDQIETYPWTSETLIKQFGSHKEDLYALENPLNPENPLLRDKMLYNFLPLAQKNSKFFESFKLFDIGRVRNRKKALHTSDLDSRYADAHISEDLTLGALIYQKSVTNWQEDGILTLKTVAKRVLNQLGIKGEVLFETSDFWFFHPKKQAKIWLKNEECSLEIGYIASLHPLILANHKFPETAQLSILELNLDLIKSLTHQQGHEKDYETLQDQLLWRDLSFVVDANASFGPLIEAIEKMTSIEEVKAFDLYQGENLGTDKKSISLQLKIKGDGSMTTDTINEILQSAIKKGESVGAKLRT